MVVARFEGLINLKNKMKLEQQDIDEMLKMLQVYNKAKTYEEGTSALLGIAAVVLDKKVKKTK